MSLSEERMQVLKMVEEGKITAEEAAKLLAALEASAKKEEQTTQSQSSGPRKRRVRICVSDSATGKQKKVNLNLPIGVVKVVKKMGIKFPAEVAGIDIDDILDEIGDETGGKIFEAQDDGGKRVEIFVE